MKSVNFEHKQERAISSKHQKLTQKQRNNVNRK